MPHQVGRLTAQRQRRARRTPPTPRPSGPPGSAVGVRRSRPHPRLEEHPAMREPPPTSYETMLATCKDPGLLRPAAERAATAMAVTTADVTVSLPTVDFNLADSASHDEQGYHVWRFGDFRRWERRY